MQEVSNIENVSLGEPITVHPSDRLFSELGNNNYDFKDLLSELIDNSLAAQLSNQTVEVVITHRYSSDDPSQDRLVIQDNASGIPHSKLGEAISPAAIQTQGSLNEHGLGMKQAIAGLGKLEYLTSKHVRDNKATRIREFKFGTIHPRELDVDWEHGTEISIRDLKPIVPKHGQGYSIVRQYIGARYRRFLTDENPLAKIVIRRFDLDIESTVNQWQIEAVKPVYFHPNFRRNEPVIDHKRFDGNGWSVELVFGYAPESDHEWSELGLEQPSQRHPYYSSLRKQGLDVILNDRVIQFHQLPELKLVGARHNDYNGIRGELVLLEGFHTAITKNNMIQTESWNQCLTEVGDFLKSNNYIKTRTYPAALPEAALRDRLTVWLEKNDLSPRKDVSKEYPIEALGGKIDILADKEVWEIKRDEAYGLDVYQLFAYMDMGNFTRGFLAAKSFRDSAYRACEHINGKHPVEITLTELEKYPINQPLSEREIEQYT